MGDEMRELIEQLQDAARKELLEVTDENYKRLMGRFDGESESHRVVRALVERNAALGKLIASVNLNEVPVLILTILLATMERESPVMDLVIALKEDALEEWTPDA